MIGQSGRGDDRHRTYTRLPPDRRGRRSLRRSLRRLLRRRSPPSPLVPPFAIPSQLVAIPVAISVAISVRRNFRRNFRSSRFPFVAILVRAISFVAIPFVPVPGLLRGRGRSIVRRNSVGPCPEHIGCSGVARPTPLARARSNALRGRTGSVVAISCNSRRNSRSQFPFVAISVRSFVAISVRRNFRSFVAISPFVAISFVAVVHVRPCPEHIGCSEAEAVRSFVRRNSVRRNSVRSSPSFMKRWRRPSRFDATRRRHRVIMVPAPSRARVAACGPPRSGPRGL